MENSADTSNTSDDQKVEADDDSISSATSNNQVEGSESSVSTTPEGVELDQESVNSSATSGAPGMKAGNYSEVSSTPEGVEAAYDDIYSQDNQDITDKDIDDMLMNVYAEKGFLGDCGVDYKVVAIGDTYWCQDKQLNRKVACEKASANLHLCCVEFDGCDDLDDMKAWRF